MKPLFRTADCGIARAKASTRIAPSVRPGMGTWSNAPRTPNTSSKASFMARTAAPPVSTSVPSTSNSNNRIIESS